MDTLYRIAIEPVEGRLRAAMAGQVVADSTRAMVLHESYQPDTYYFPKDDVADALLAPSEFRTFCPFKGTASYWNLGVAGNAVENGAWSYESPLQEALDIGGMVSFDASAVDQIYAEPPLPARNIELVGGSSVLDWLISGAWLCKTPAQLTEQFAQCLVATGVPLWRFMVNIWTLHPELAGQRFAWTRDGDGVVESDTPHGQLQSPAYLNSPVRFVSEGLGGVRQRLDVDDPEFTYPILNELRAQGGTDYVAIPLAFSDGQFQTMTMATDHPDGFSTAQLGETYQAFAVLGRFYEAMTLRRNTSVLFDTYLGERTRANVLGGLIQRGDGEEIRAAILYCDLRDSTVLSETLSREVYLHLLNDFFERAVEPVQARGGEVLKFIGDAVLAIFPVEADEADGQDTVAACRRARAAAEEIVARMAAAPAHSNRPPLRCAVGLHFGDLMYGNVGAPRRLDFTVIGQAANIAARLSTLCKDLEQPLVFSADFARHTPEGLHSRGAKQLRNVSDSVEVFTVTGAEFG
jgi:adenylate cyclase